MGYADDPRFSSYVFEESYVLGVHVGLNWVVVELDACLSNQHPEATVKRGDDWAAFRPAQLWFKQAASDYQRSNARPSLDADDSWDYGTLDRFEICEEGEYLLAGEFGCLRIEPGEAFVREFSDG